MGILDGRTILVAGVTMDSSIGFATARFAQEQGATVLISNFGRALGITRRIAKRLPQEAPVLELDVTDEDHLAGLPVPPELRREKALGTPDDVAPLVVWLASDRAAEVTGQAIGIGGDRLTLYAHPQVLDTDHRDGGWSAEEIDAAWTDRFAAQAQPSGPPSRKENA